MNKISGVTKRKTCALISEPQTPRLPKSLVVDVAGLLVVVLESLVKETISSRERERGHVYDPGVVVMSMIYGA